MATLTNTKIKDTYDGLLKTTDNDVIGITEKVITDGLGNASVLSIGTASASFSSDIEVNGLTIGKGNGSLSTNIAVGVNALDSVTSGVDNTAIGHSTMQNLTLGVDNAAFGTGAMVSTTTGSYNTSIGSASLPVNTTGQSNTAVGLQAMQVNTTGGANTVVGMNALNDNTEGNRNTTLGFGSGNGIITGSDNIHIGYNTTSGATDVSNEIVIGSNATGNGSNTATYGNSSITDHYFDGNVRADFFYGDGSNLTNLPSSTTPTLQQVTTAGSTTDRTIVIERQSSPALDFEDSTATGTTSSYIRFKRSNSSTNYGRIAYNSVGDDMVFSTTTPSNTVLTLTGTGNAEVSNNLDVSGDLVVDTNTLYVDASNNRVGIGTSSPNVAMQINQASSAPLLIHRPNNTSFDPHGIVFSTRGDSVDGGLGDARSGIFSDYNGDLFLAAAETGITGSPETYARLFIDGGTGNVGIGLTPSMIFQVKSSGTSTEDVASFGNANISDGLVVTTNGNLDWGFNARNSRNLTFSTNQTEKMRIDSSGNVGINCSPASGVKLQVNGDGSIFRLDGTANTSRGMLLRNVGTATAEIKTDGNLDFNIEDAGRTMRFLNGNTERMRITSGGDVLINTQTSSNYEDGFRVKPNGSGTGTLTEAYNDGGGTALIVGRGGSDGIAVDFRRGSSQVGSISVTTTATAYNTSSDYRLKENVVEMTGALDRVDALKPSRFNFIADPEKTVDGFIAHEVQAIVPEAVTGEKDAVDEEGNPIYQGIDQSKIVPLLVGAIKELSAKVAALESQLNA